MTVQSVHRAAKLLRALAGTPVPRHRWAPEAHVGHRLSDLARAADLDKATTHRLLASLADEGLVELDPDTRRYRLGLELFVLGNAFLPRFDLRELAAGSLSRLAQETGDTVYLSIRQQLQAVCLDRREGAFPIKTLPLDIGSRRPLGIGAGSLAILAFEPDPLVERAIAAGRSERTAFGVFPDERIWQMVQATRQRGHAINPGETVTGMSAVGVPILNSAGNVRAAVSIAAISERLEGERRERAIALLQQEARTIAAGLSSKPAAQSARQAERSAGRLEQTGG